MKRFFDYLLNGSLGKLLDEKKYFKNIRVFALYWGSTCLDQMHVHRPCLDRLWILGGIQTAEPRICSHPLRHLSYPASLAM